MAGYATGYWQEPSSDLLALTGDENLEAVCNDWQCVYELTTGYQQGMSLWL